MNSAPDIPTTGTRDDEQERLGIIRIPTERFEVGGYRYERLSDAVAEATRRNALGAGR